MIIHWMSYTTIYIVTDSLEYVAGVDPGTQPGFKGYMIPGFVS